MYDKCHQVFLSSDLFTLRPCTEQVIGAWLYKKVEYFLSLQFPAAPDVLVQYFITISFTSAFVERFSRLGDLGFNSISPNTVDFFVVSFHHYIPCLCFILISVLLMYCVSIHLQSYKCANYLNVLKGRYHKILI